MNDYKPHIGPLSPLTDAERREFSAKMWVAARGAGERMKALEKVAQAARAYRAAELVEIDYSQPGAMSDEPASDPGLSSLEKCLFARPSAVERALGERIEAARKALDAALKELEQQQRGAAVGEAGK